MKQPRPLTATTVSPGPLGADLLHPGVPSRRRPMLSPLFTAAASLARVSDVVAPAGWVAGRASPIRILQEEPEAVLLNLINKRLACSVPYTPAPS